MVLQLLTTKPRSEEEVVTTVEPGVSTLRLKLWNGLPFSAGVYVLEIVSATTKEDAGFVKVIKGLDDGITYRPEDLELLEKYKWGGGKIKSTFFRFAVLPTDTDGSHQ